MSFPRYPKYKDSGVEWLGVVPEHWAVNRLGSIFRQVNESGEDHLAILCVSIHDGVSDKELGEEEMDRKVTRSDDRSKYKKVEPGDLVYNMMRAWQGGFGAVAVQGMVSPAYVVARPSSAFSTPFIEHLLRTPEAIEQMRRYSQGVTDFRLRLYWEEFKTICIVLPPSAEQVAIIEFLEQETSKIDALVEEQERLIELLKEKRQAVISHAVTKGLTPHAPMKPSGVEWLGDVPAHWELFPLKRELDFVTSGSRGWAENYSDEGEVFIRIANLTRDGIDLDLSEIQRVAVPDGTEGSRTRVQAGDVLFSITAYLGSVAVIPEMLEAAYVSQHVALARLLQHRLLPRWVGYVALSTLGQTWFQTQSYGGTKVQLSLDDVMNLPVTVPPLSEQRTITMYLDAELAGFSTLIMEAQRAIDLLQERRTALISAAVTGQIDVRHLAKNEIAA